MTSLSSLPTLRDRVVVLDTETDGLMYWDGCTAFGAAIVIDGGPAFYLDERETPRMWEWLADELPRAAMLINHHVKFDLHMLEQRNVSPPRLLWCTMNVEALINEHRMAYDLDSVCSYRGIGRKYHLDGPIHQHSPKDVRIYAEQDARLTWDLYTQQVNDALEQELGRVIDLEMRLLPILTEMEHVGVRVDLEKAHAMIPILTEKIDQLQWMIDKAVGRPLNINSTPQIRALFKPERLSKYSWQLVDGTIVGPTKSGDNPSIDQKVLKEMKHPVAADIRNLRKLIKTRDTFLKGHIIGHADDNGYVHTTFNQTRNDDDAGTGSGRLSSTDPALQQINKRDKNTAEIVRACFLPDDGCEWMCADYEQVDFRMAAHLINDERIIKAYANDPSLDYHQIVSDMTNIPRNPAYAGGPNAKQLNLSLTFGAGAGKIAFTMGMPYEISEKNGRMYYLPGPEAQAVLEQYHSRLPGVRRFMKHAETVAANRGFVRTAMGRRLRFPRGVGAHKAAGLLYQAYAADMHKLGLIQMYDAINSERIGARMMLSVHDEVGLSVPDDLTEKEKQILNDSYTDSSVLNLRVPITCDVKIGPNWYEASK